MDSNQISESTEAAHMEEGRGGGGGGGGEEEGEPDPESNSLHQPLIKGSPTLSSNPLALVGAKVSHIESLDYEINENDLFKHDWRSRTKVQVLQYIFLKWAMAFLVGLLTGGIASFINLAVENIAGLKMLAVARLVVKETKQQFQWPAGVSHTPCHGERCWYITGFLYFTGANLALTLFASVLCVVFAPTAAGPGIPEIKAYLNGVNTPNMFGASTLIVKVSLDSTNRF